MPNKIEKVKILKFEQCPGLTHSANGDTSAQNNFRLKFGDNSQWHFWVGDFSADSEQGAGNRIQKSTNIRVFFFFIFDVHAYSSVQFVPNFFYSDASFEMRRLIYSPQAKRVEKNKHTFSNLNIILFDWTLIQLCVCPVPTFFMILCGCSLFFQFVSIFHSHQYWHNASTNIQPGAISNTKITSNVWQFL